MFKCIFLFVLLPISLFSQKLIKDIDFDTIKDTIYVDNEKSTIVCILSSKNNKKIESLPIGLLNERSGIVDAKNGFKFNNDWMRAGYSNQFRYDKRTKKIRLIGMSRYEFGNAANDGSGESSVNLLTGNYIGNWNHYDLNKDKLVKLPSIKTKMHFNKVYLESFDDGVYFGYSEKCSKLYYKTKENYKAKENNHD